MQIKIGIVVVSFHNPDMTTHYVTQELPKLTVPYTLVVVNVASTQEESQQLAEACGLQFVDVDTPAVQGGNGYLIWDKVNLGYAQGNNKGVRFLNSIGSFKHYLFSNDDIEIKDTNILNVLADKMDEHENVACVGPRIIGIDGCEQSPHDRYISPYRLIAWRFFSWLRKNNVSSTANQYSDPKSRYTYWVSGAFMMVDADIFTKVGMFDESTFLYLEEVILAERFARLNKYVFFESSVKVLHYEGGSTSKSDKRKRVYERESRTIYYKNYRHVNRLIIAFCNFIYNRSK